MLLGAHVSTAGGIQKAPANGADLNINYIQVFTKNQRQWKAKEIESDQIMAWKEQIIKHNIKKTVSHNSYLINMCAPDKEKLEKSLNAMGDELERAEKLGITHVVAHPGSHLKEGEEWGITKIAESITELHKRYPGYKTKIALEVTAGMGSNIGYNFEQIAGIIEQSKENDRLAVCFDTCHAFAAGYAIHEKDGYESTWADFDRIIGLDRLQVFHLNDSKKPFASKRDRHEHIGQGEIGIDCFKWLMNDKRFENVAGFLETPEDDWGGYAEDIEVLRSLVGEK